MGSKGASSSSGNLFDPGDGGGGEVTTPSASRSRSSRRIRSSRSTSAIPRARFSSRRKIKATGQEVPASWTIDRGELGSISLTTGLFTASHERRQQGHHPGRLRRTGHWTSVTIKAEVVPERKHRAAARSRRGHRRGVASAASAATVLAAKVDQATIDRLTGATETDNKLAALYPDGGTVWPRGILPPLSCGSRATSVTTGRDDQALGDELRIRRRVREQLADGQFQNYQIRRRPGNSSCRTAAKGQRLHHARDGGQAFGPLTKWKVASAPLKGIVYWQSYGTKLAKNYDGALPDVPGRKGPLRRDARRCRLAAPPGRPRRGQHG